MEDKIREQFRRMANALGQGCYHGVKVSLGANKGETFLKERVSRKFEVEPDKTITHTNTYESMEDYEEEAEEETFDYSLEVGLKRKEPAFYYKPGDESAKKFDRLKVYFQGGTPMGIIKVQRSPGTSGFRTTGELFFSREPNLRCTISASYFETGSLRGFLQYREDRNGYPSKHWTSDIALIGKQEFPQGRFVGSERTITADLKDSIAKDVVWKGPPAEQSGYKCFYFTDGIGIQAPIRLIRNDEYFFRAWWVYKGDKMEVYENIARLMNGKVISLRSGVYTQTSETAEINEVPVAGPVEAEYIVTTYTGKKNGAGTDANVIVTILGEEGESGPHNLDNKGDNFESGQVDTFTVTSAKNLGNVTKVRVGHDNKGFAAAWYLSKVTVEDRETGQVYEFPCHSWIPDKKTKSLFLELNTAPEGDLVSSESEEEKPSEEIPADQPGEEQGDVPEDPTAGLTDEDLDRLMMGTGQ